ncbi:MAG: Crp/Fnr family transcriptional regulator [Melioribacteraceae bacterium]|nr:Crp/Fnr family transcriptional regulator [Melioribacteraceae bacterium]MCF8430352.1 Crp/Fnr family transcriptional regulator [Melioribacteraceae bacterium]
MELEKILLKIFERFASVSENSFKEVLDLISLKTYPPNYYFVNEGKREESEYFVLDGIIRSNIFTRKGEDVTLSFFYEKSVLPPCISRTNDGISTLNFQSLSEVKIAIINANLFRELMQKHLDLYQFGNMVMMSELQIKAKKEISFATLSAKVRLEELRSQFPGIENLIPHTHIASYLGITPISLSRLRNKQ